MPGTLEHLAHEIIALTEEKSGELIEKYNPVVICFGLRKYVTSASKAIQYYQINPSFATRIEIEHELALLVMRVQVLSTRLGIDLCEAIRFSFNDVAEQFKSHRRMEV